jgi:hypothetical protein
MINHRRRSIYPSRLRAGFTFWIFLDMSFCLFLTASADRCLSPAASAGLTDSACRLARSVEQLRKLIVHVPAVLNSRDPYLASEIPPACVLQLYFDDIANLEAALAEAGPLQALFDDARFPMLAGCDWTQQAMAVRRFPISGSLPPDDAHGSERCTYLVCYEGPADDVEAWLAHYIRQHPPIMARLPGVREVEMYTRIDYCSGLAAARSNAMQRNKAVFDSAAALSHSLTSPVRDELRADFNTLPPFSGETPHYPMHSFVTVV